MIRVCGTAHMFATGTNGFISSQRFSRRTELHYNINSLLEIPPTLHNEAHLHHQQASPTKHINEQCLSLVPGASMCTYTRVLGRV